MRGSDVKIFAASKLICRVFTLYLIWKMQNLSQKVFYKVGTKLLVCRIFPESQQIAWLDLKWKKKIYFLIGAASFSCTGNCGMEKNLQKKKILKFNTKYFRGIFFKTTQLIFLIANWNKFL